MTKKNFLSIAAMAVSAVLTGCGPATSLTIPMNLVRPAEVDMRGIRVVALGEFKLDRNVITPERERLTVGMTDTELTEHLTRVLLESGRFELADGRHSALARSYDGNEADREKLSGTALIKGQVNERYNEDITRSESKRKDEKTGKEVITHTYTRKGTATIQASLEVVDTYTSRLLKIKDFTKSASDSKSSANQSPAAINGASLFRQCREAIVRDFIRVIAPYTERVRVTFLIDEEIPELKRGYDMATVKDWDAAIGVFERAIETYSNSDLVHKAYYNLGLAYTYTDQFDRARTSLQKAYVEDPSDLYLRAIKRLNERIEDKRRLDD